MKTKISLLVCVMAAAFCLTACKTPTVEPGGPYAPTNTIGQVLYTDTGLALADTSYKLAYETVIGVMRFERDNRLAIWAISPDVKRTLDTIRPQVVEIRLRWATARKLYKANPTPAGLNTLQTILAEIQRLLPVVQSQLSPVYSTLTKEKQ